MQKTGIRIILTALWWLWIQPPLYAQHGTQRTHLPEAQAPPSASLLMANFFPRSSHFSNSPFRNMSTRKNIPVAPKKEAELEARYQDVLSTLKRVLAESTPQKGSSTLVYAYWQAGEVIAREEKKRREEGYDSNPFIKRIAQDLNQTETALRQYTTFYRLYETLADVSPNLTWAHYQELIQIHERAKRESYQTRAIQGYWSVAVLKQHIQNGVETVVNNGPSDSTPNEKPAQTIDGRLSNIFKASYAFPFIKDQKLTDEKQAEALFANHIPQFLEILGNDFSFMGQSVPIRIGNVTHTIDMVLYHRHLLRTILVEIKVGPLDIRDIGRINRCVGYFRRNRQYRYEKLAVGLILCNQINREELVYALDGLETRIHVATY